VQLFELEALLADRETSGRAYHEFLRVSALSAGLYVLATGGTDTQQPHTEDELYVVMRGRATAFVGGERRPVGPGDTLYVAAGVEHRFEDITEELALIVFFARAEGSAAG
jgi:mannose-6-phosphate isomerase-like protein (cupin superfamily)